MKTEEVRVSAGPVTLEGTLTIPDEALGVVLFAHGSGSSRHSPRNRAVAAELQRGGLVTLLVDLLTADEETVDLRTRHLRFDIGLLAERLVGATAWLADHADTRDLRVGYFGASTGGGAALVAAARLSRAEGPKMRGGRDADVLEARAPERAGAVVSRGGRPDLAGEALPEVQAPTLLIVGGYDYQVIAMNEEAYAQLKCEKRLEIVPRATHLFEEPGTLEVVARLAREWFARHLPAAQAKGRRRAA